MPGASGHQVKQSMALAEDVGHGGIGPVLSGIFETLDGADVPYCVLHGYENYPRMKSDVDCVISEECGLGPLLELLHRNSARIGAEVVRCWDDHVTLASKNANGSPCFVVLDLSELKDRLFYAASEVLESRRRHNQLWIPAAHIEFGYYLVKKITNGSLDGEQALRLSVLYEQDAAGCAGQVARFWGDRSTARILSAARSGDWEPVRRRLRELGAEARRRAGLRSSGRVIGARLRGCARRIRRCWQPDGGLNVIFLGVDGAGKSSVIEAISPMLAGAFRGTSCYSFPPALVRRLLRRGEPRDALLLRGGRPGYALPHASKRRSYPMSAVRAVLYWLPYYTLGYLSVHLSLARNALIVHDRHMVDALVDPVRYRYGGPPWLLHLLWRLVPKPDLVILLDAPAGVVQARKQEVPFEETVRQRKDYLSLVATMRNGRVVNAAQPLEYVIRDVNDVIVQYLTTRTARRFELEHNPTTQPGAALAATFHSSH
jgi:thymidylate kinase